jgi:hypothetical protein
MESPTARSSRRLCNPSSISRIGGLKVRHTLSDKTVGHVFRFEGGKVVGFDIRDPD